MQKHKLELPTAPPVTGRVPRSPQPVQAINDGLKDRVVHKPVSLPQEEKVAAADTIPSSPEFDDATAQRIGDLLQEFVVELDSKKRFDDALVIARLHRNVQPQNLTGFYTEALMLFSLGRYDEARGVLLNAPGTVWDYPQFHHNMACIEVGLGNLPAGLEHATNAARLNKNALREMLKDPDLKPIWVPLKQNTKDIR
ncbi:MAG: hypothetical protein IAE77_20110 [Prosthecobacter sp.]|uniref:hypothetical protein n=1 Tax=Prosthecobacter sp. TaxID=1965333 RepID=UPI0019EADBF9|nr:hypothetical protein [Prosthecobacter sp.]MBE2285776.1 hypothetical protein [Prosthecobacter sp.]